MSGDTRPMGCTVEEIIGWLETGPELTHDDRRFVDGEIHCLKGLSVI